MLIIIFVFSLSLRYVILFLKKGKYFARDRLCAVAMKIPANLFSGILVDMPPGQ